MPSSSSPWVGLSDDEEFALVDLLFVLKGPDRHCVVVGDLRIQRAGPGPDEPPVSREDLVRQLRDILAWLKGKGGDPGKVYRAALQIDTLGKWSGLPSPLVPHPLPRYDEVKPQVEQ